MMTGQISLQLINAAQKGSEEASAILAKQVREDIGVFILRQTMDDNLTEDLTQETVLEMIKSLPRLQINHEDFFWAWLYRTALGKIQHHFRLQGNKRLKHKMVMNDDRLKQLATSEISGVRKLIRAEFKQAVIDSINALNLAYRSTLTLRCYEQLSFAQIATITGQSELQARVRFYRAKMSLKKQLVRRGIDKNNFHGALILFGALTAGLSKKAFAAPVNATLLEAGQGATLLGIFLSKSTIIGAIAAMAIIYGMVSIVPSSRQSVQPGRTLISNLSLPNRLIEAYTPAGQTWQATNRQNRVDIQYDEMETRVLRPSSQSGSFLLLPAESWIHVAFSGPLVDGPGVDIILDVIPTGAGPHIWLTDGGSQAVELAESARRPTRGGFFFIEYDLNNIQPAFTPIALRITGSSANGSAGCVFYEVRARTSATR